MITAASISISSSSSIAGGCQAGACLFLVMCAILTLKAQLARFRPIENTELWSLVDERPRIDIGQQVFGLLLRDCYLEFALHMARLSAMLMAAGIIVSLAN